MPAHWYYNTEFIKRDYGRLTEYKAPNTHHPESILWRCRYKVTCEKDDILHDQAQYWGKPGVHYHQFLQAGENTLNLKIAALLAESLIECKTYDHEDFLERYIDFMLRPGTHNDTYVEEAHRTFFKNYALGKPPEKCGAEDTNVGGLATLTPLILFYRKRPVKLHNSLRNYLSLTHKGETTVRAADLYAETCVHALRGESIEHILFEIIGRHQYQALTFPYHRWMSNHEDHEIVGKKIGNGCPIEDALPATLYLALKYADDFEHGLVRNAHLGGDNSHRGALLGTLLGATGGCESIPGEWVEELWDMERYDQLGEALWAASEGVE